MFCRLFQTPFAALLLLILLSATTLPALAQDELDDSDEPTEEVVDDEDVEDIEESAPRRQVIPPSTERHLDTAPLPRKQTAKGTLPKKKALQQPAPPEQPA
ncbi:hypothetical protein, partial [Porticoccus sp.]